jgi:hypothetical protein
VSKNTVAEIMREQGLVARGKRRRWWLTQRDRNARKAPDLLRREFGPPQRPNVHWCGDLTDVPCAEGKFYLASVLDLHSRRCVGFAVGAHHDPELARAGLCTAIAVRGGDVAGVIFLTDQGGEYTGGLFTQACTAAGVRQSMGRTGTALDKSLVSQCTSWRGLRQSSVLEGASLPCDQPGIAGVGWFEQSHVLVVGLVRGQQPGAARQFLIALGWTPRRSAISVMVSSPSEPPRVRWRV